MNLIKKGNINNKIMDIVNPDEYLHFKDCYDPRLTAVEYNDIAYPVYETDTINLNKPGFYVGTCISQFVNPNEEQMDIYRLSTNKTILDFSNINSSAEMIEKTNLLKDIEKEILTTSDNVTVYPISDEDSPEMKTMKECINSKKINIDNYANKIPNFNNNKRLLKNKHDITLSKILEIAGGLDLKCTLQIEDKSTDCPNPMNRKIVTSLNTGSENKGDMEDE